DTHQMKSNQLNCFSQALRKYHPHILNIIFFKKNNTDNIDGSQILQGHTIQLGDGSKERGREDLEEVLIGRVTEVVLI
ncbi:hypothetical protein ACJX0J_006601, partial [Zea mays]